MSAAPQLALWQRALLVRIEQASKRNNAGARARLALVSILARAGVDVSLVTVHRWTRERQGQAYQWAHAFVCGCEDLPPPPFVLSDARAPLAKTVWPAVARHWRVRGG